MRTVERQSAQACPHRQLTVRVTVPSTPHAVRARCRAANATRSAAARASSRPALAQDARPSVHWILAVTGAAVIVRNGRLDVLAANQLERALYIASATGRAVSA